MTVEFRLLGDVEVAVEGQLVDVGHARQRAVLVALLYDVNRVVSVDDLVDRVWGHDPPQRRRELIYGYVSRIRRALRASGEVTIARGAGGYVLTTDTDAIDLHRFRRLVARVRTASDDEALGLFEQALGLWRGRPFGPLDTRWVAALRTTLWRERFATELDRNDVALRRGLHAGVLAGLFPLVASHPFDERLTGQLMLALHRSGRTADALSTYRRLRQRLTDELGVDPGPELRRIELAVLRGETVAGDHRPDAPAYPPAARQPGEPGSGVDAGRDSSVALLDEVIDRCVDRPQRPGEYRYFEARSPGGSSGGDGVTEMWIPLDPFDDWLIRQGRVGEPQQEYRGPYGGGYLPAGGSWRMPTPNFYAMLPRDPVSLRELLRWAQPEPFFDIRNALSQFPAPADVRVAMFRLLRDEPTTLVTENVPTLDLRRAIAVGVMMRNGPCEERSDLLIDPANGEVLGASSCGSPVTANRHAIVDGLGRQP